MNSQQQIQLLRAQLLAMARLSQRALDYSIKGYSLRQLDFSRHVPAASHEIEEHHRRMKELSCELLNGGIAKSADARFAFAAQSIGNALHAIHSAAMQIAQDTVRLLESTGLQSCLALETTAQDVNASMRLCVVALFEKDAAHAQTVLKHKNQSRFRELNSVALHPHIDRWAGAQGDFERSVIRSLGEAAKQMHEMADAVLFWLERNPCAASIDARHIVHGLPVSQQTNAAALSYMASERMPDPKASHSFSC
jgi:hypothetical protein